MSISKFISLPRLLVALAVLGLRATTVFAQSTGFDVGRDFSTANNPNGVWTFGWAGTVTGAVVPLTVRRDSPADNGAYTPSWQLTYDTAPVVYCNISDQTTTVGGGIAALAPHEVLFDGGQDGSPQNFVVIRFTAPTNGHYTVATTVRPFYNGPPQGDADFHVVKNGTELFVQFLNPYQSANYTNTLALSAGDTIKFLLGRGADGHEYGSIFRIAASINSGGGSTNSNPTNPPVNLAGFDAARDFSATSNPSGVWSYGWKGTLGGTFNVFPNARRAFAPNDMPYDIWEGDLTLPNVMHYPWTNPLPGINGTSTLPPGTLLLDPGVEGSGKNYTVARFTAPSNALYRLETAVAPCYDGPPQGDTDFHVVKNGTELVGLFLATTQHFSYATELLLNGGDTVDFAAGRGGDDIEYGSILKLTAVLTATNAPAGCNYSILPGSRTHGYGAATNTVAVTAGAGCAWSISNTNSWVNFVSGTSGTGNGTVVYSITANPTANARSGNVQIAGLNFAITQAEASLPQPTDFVLGHNFSSVQNPHGAWSYGWSPTVGGAFTPLLVPHTSPTENGVLVPSWQLTPYWAPVVYCNTSSVPAIFGNGAVQMPPGAVWFAPGQDGRPENFAVIRFIAPASSNYLVRAAVQPVYPAWPQGDTDFHVVQDTEELFGIFLSPTQTASFSNVVALAAGETIQFVLGRGADGSEYGSSLRIAASITPTGDGPTVITNPPPQAPVIVTQPVPYQSVNAGSMVHLSVVAWGTGPLSYQWLFQNAPLAGAQSDALVLNNVQFINAGQYQVVVSSDYGAVTSTVALVNVTSNLPGAGMILFANNSTNRVIDVDGTNFVTGDGTLVVGLFAGTDPEDFQILAPPIGFTQVPGRFYGGPRTIPNTVPSQLVWMQVKVWDSAFGDSYEEAIAVGGKRGDSGLFQARLGGSIIPPGTLSTMPSFALSLPGSPAPQVAAAPAAPATPLVLRRLVPTANGWTLTLTGPAATTCAIEMSTDLVTWTTVAYVVNESGVVDYHHGDNSEGRRFYRVRLVNP